MAEAGPRGGEVREAAVADQQRALMDAAAEELAQLKAALVRAEQARPAAGPCLGYLGGVCAGLDVCARVCTAAKRSAPKQSSGGGGGAAA